MGGVRILHRNLLLPFKTRVLDDEITPQEEPEDCNQTGTIEDSIHEDQEDSSEDEQNPTDVSKDGDETSVSTRPWTRSQGPPPAMVDTNSLSKCVMDKSPTLPQEEGGDIIPKPPRSVKSLRRWANSLWVKLHHM